MRSRVQPRQPRPWTAGGMGGGALGLEAPPSRRLRECGPASHSPGDQQAPSESQLSPAAGLGPRGLGVLGVGTVLTDSSGVRSREKTGGLAVHPCGHPRDCSVCVGGAGLRGHKSCADLLPPQALGWAWEMGP